MDAKEKKEVTIQENEQIVDVEITDVKTWSMTGEIVD